MVAPPRPRRNALAPSTAAVTPIRNELTAAMVGSTSRTRLFQMRTVRVCTSTPDRNRGINSSSNDVRNANSADDRRPGRISGSVMRRNAVRRLAPRLSAACSRRTSKPWSVAAMMMTTTGRASTVWPSAMARMLPVTLIRTKKK